MTYAKAGGTLAALLLSLVLLGGHAPPAPCQIALLLPLDLHGLGA